jgi:hypothetical protein
MARIIFSFAPAVNVILHPNTISALQACSSREQREEKFASRWPLSSTAQGCPVIFHEE